MSQVSSVSPAKPAPSLEENNARAIEAILGGISLKLLESFCQRMATGLSAGVDILRLLDMEGKAGSTRHRDVARSMGEQVRLGNGLADAMHYQGRYFPNLLIKMVAAGESAGGLDRVFQEMADYYRDLKKSRGEFASMITWPVIQLCLAIFIGAVVILVNGFFTSGSVNDKPFDMTGIGLRGVRGMLLYLTYVAIFFGAIGIIAFGIWKNWMNCHRTLVPIARKIPVIGSVITTTALSRLSMTLSMLLGAGVDAKRSVRDALLSTGNYYYISGLKSTMAEIERGKLFSEALAAPNLLPDEFIQNVAIGELSGSDSESLERMAQMYRGQARLAMKKLAVLSGVAIWLLIAAMIIAAIFLMFFQILQVYSGAMNMK